MLSVVPPILAVTAGVREFLVRRCHALRADASYHGYDGKVEWNEQTPIVYAAVCSIVGVIAGMFGVGGGIVKVQSPGSDMKQLHSLSNGAPCHCIRYFCC